MALRVTIDRVATYRAPSTLQCDKKVALLYGLNGTGKSTLSNYLYSPTEKKFAACSREGFDDAHVYVYNATFVRDNFYEVDKLGGVFTLSKVNRDIEEEIKKKTAALHDLEVKQVAITADIAARESKFSGKRSAAEDSVWEIKKKYSGGDRVLEYCLKGMMKSKEALFDHVAGLSAPTEAPTKTAEMLKKEVEAIQGDQAKSFQALPTLQVLAEAIERDPIFEQPIIGNQDSPIADLINKLDSGDWVSQGVPYIDLLQSEGDDRCPFCQAQTLSAAVAQSIKSYFDETFETSLATLKALQAKYKFITEKQSIFNAYDDNPFYTANKTELDALYSGVVAIWRSNQDAIERKVKAPSAPVVLTESSAAIAKLNNMVNEVNKAIAQHNVKIENREAALEQIKGEFWKICRWEHKAVIDVFKKVVEERLVEHKDDQAKSNKLIVEKRALIAELAELQKKTVNIEEAIGVINSRLSDLGIDSFHIIKAAENRYKVSRNGTEGEDFLTLSEGEKTVISFLYFVELCKGKRTATEVGEKKIVVIDDPISSLSHLYIFNIGEMIKAEFCNSDKFEHVIIMTHSLYFFYELTETNHDVRKQKQNLLRIVKNSAGSKIVEMKYEEIQNDYQAYWNVIMDEEQHPALIANCMRNIIEYFFNFVKKMPLSNIFQQAKFKNPQHLAFYRFMNRESHSLGQNIFDHKEFDYARFKESFKLVFEDAGFLEHYTAMAKGR